MTEDASLLFPWRRGIRTINDKKGRWLRLQYNTFLAPLSPEWERGWG